jgi:hypothetical protein
MFWVIAMLLTTLRLSTTPCVSFSIRYNNCTILSSPVYTFTSPSSQLSVLPALCLHFYISVKSALSSSGSPSTLLQHLRQGSLRFFRLSVYTSPPYPSSQPSVLPALRLHFYNISVKSATGFIIALSTLCTTSSNQPSLVFRQHITSQTLG